MDRREDEREPLDPVSVDNVLIENNSTLGTLLTSSHEWREEYADDVAKIYIRDGADER